MFGMMKEFVKDPSCCTMHVSHRHIVESMKYVSTEYHWMTQVEVYIACHARADPKYKEYADKLLTGAKSKKKHPAFPKDQDMQLHKILKTMLEGTAKRTIDKSDISVGGEINDAETGQKLMDKIAKQKPLSKAVADEDADAPPTSKRSKPTPTPKVKGKGKGKATVKQTPYEVVHGNKLLAKRNIQALSRSESRLDAACVEALGLMLPVVEQFEKALEDADVCCTSPDAIRAEYEKALVEGPLRNFTRELEFAQSRASIIGS